MKMPEEIEVDPYAASFGTSPAPVKPVIAEPVDPVDDEDELDDDTSDDEEDDEEDGDEDDASQPSVDDDPLLAEAQTALDQPTDEHLKALERAEAERAANLVRTDADRAKQARKADRARKKEMAYTNPDGSTNFDRFGSGTPVKVGTFFVSGNNAKAKALLRKVQRGEAPLADVPDILVKYVNEESEQWYSMFGKTTDPKHTSHFYQPAQG